MKVFLSFLEVIKLSDMCFQLMNFSPSVITSVNYKHY